MSIKYHTYEYDTNGGRTARAHLTLKFSTDPYWGEELESFKIDKIEVDGLELKEGRWLFESLAALALDGKMRLISNEEEDGY